jgi:hypothetical protein
MFVKSESPDTPGGVWTVGIDDTDMPGIGGTGQLARRIAVEIDTMAIGTARGVTRHQLYEGSGVPKTSRNSSAAITFGGVGDSAELFETVCAIVIRDAIKGSDPGVAMLSGAPNIGIVSFARRAQAGLVIQSEARQMAEMANVVLVGLGGTDDGVIGALCAAALRADGNDGRYVGLVGIRDLSGVVTAAELIDRSGIVAVVDGESVPLSGSSELRIGDWLRPRLIGGQPVLVARRGKEGWVNADARPR